MQKKNRPSLAQKITLFMGVGLLIMLTGIVWITYSYSSEAMIRLGNNKLSYVLRTQANNAVDLLQHRDQKALEAIVRNLTRDDLILGAVIYEIRNGEEIPIATSGASAADSGEGVLLSMPIQRRASRGAVTIGKLNIWADYGVIDTEVNRLSTFMSQVAFFAFVALILLVHITVTQSLKPIALLSKYMAHESGGALSDIPVDSLELSQLIAAVDTLQQRHDRQQEEILQAIGDAEKARKHADISNRAKSDFLANMSHELRTPLNSILGMLQLLMEKPLSGEQREMLNTVEMSSQNLLTLVNDILDLSKIESSNLSLEKVPFGLRRCLERVLHMLQPIASKRGLLLSQELNIPPNLVVLGDPTRFSQVLTNVINNALKYTEKGSVAVLVQHEKRGDDTVSVSIHVIDTGIGIPKHVLPTIFDKFVQADTSTTRRFGGTGLGLAITKQLITLMGGNISVDSVEGNGSRFTIRVAFPTAAEYETDVLAGPILTQSTLNIPAGRHIRLLVAEDHTLNQLFIKKLLPAIGIEDFDIVDNGVRAIKALKEKSYDAILMDCHMPEMSGYDASRQIRQTEGENGGHVPIIAMTANAMEGERETCLACGMDDYITKPVDRQKLVYILSRILALDTATMTSDTTATLQPIEQKTKLPLLDLSCIRSYSNGDVAMEREFAEVFVTDSRRTLQKLSDCCVDGTSDVWKEAAHLFKGGAATIGAMQLRALCADAQNMFDATADARREILIQISAAHHDVVAELQRLDLYPAEPLTMESV